MINMKKNFNIKKTKGFTLLFAVIISSLLLSIGVAILDLALKQFSLSSTGKNSQVAFYAADNGLECGLFWDRNASGVSAASVFATSSQSGNQTGAVNCDGVIIPQLLLLMLLTQRQLFGSIIQTQLILLHRVHMCK